MFKVRPIKIKDAILMFNYIKSLREELKKDGAELPFGLTYRLNKQLKNISKIDSKIAEIKKDCLTSILGDEKTTELLETVVDLEKTLDEDEFKKVESLVAKEFESEVILDVLTLDILPLTEGVLLKNEGSAVLYDLIDLLEEYNKPIP